MILEVKQVISWTGNDMRESNRLVIFISTGATDAEHSSKCTACRIRSHISRDQEHLVCKSKDPYSQQAGTAAVGFSCSVVAEMRILPEQKKAGEVGLLTARTVQSLPI